MSRPLRPCICAGCKQPYGTIPIFRQYWHLRCWRRASAEARWEAMWQTKEGKPTLRRKQEFTR